MKISNIIKLQTFPSFRLFMLISRVRSLREIVEKLNHCTRSLFYLVTLLIGTIYIFAVMFTAYFKDMYDEGLTTDDYFSRLDSSFFTLFQITTLSSWSEIVREVMDTYSWAGILFVIYIIVSSFVLMNMFVSYVVDSYLQSNDGIQNDMICVDNEINVASDTILNLMQSQQSMLLLIDQVEMEKSFKRVKVI